MKLLNSYFFPPELKKMIFLYRSHGSGSWSRPGNGATGHSESMGKFLKLVPCEKYEEDQVSSNSFRTLMKL